MYYINKIRALLKYIVKNVEIKAKIMNIIDKDKNKL